MNELKTIGIAYSLATKLKNIKQNIVFLKVYQYQFIDRRKRHYYGDLYSYDMQKCVELERPLTRIQAIELNKFHEVDSTLEIENKEGDLYPGFDSEKQLENFAIEKYLDHFPNATMLVKVHSRLGIVLFKDNDQSKAKILHINMAKYNE